MTSWTLRRTAGASAALIAAGTLCLAAGGSATYAASPKAGTNSFTFVTAGTQLDGKAGPQVGLFHGAINAGGKDVPLAQSDVIHLPGGSITVKHPGSESKYVPKVDAATCYATFTITGKFTLVGGTGAYAGTTGSGKYVGHGYGYLARNKDGSCSQSAAPKSEVFEISARGTVS